MGSASDRIRWTVWIQADLQKHVRGWFPAYPGKGHKASESSFSQSLGCRLTSKTCHGEVSSRHMGRQKQQPKRAKLPARAAPAALTVSNPAHTARGCVGLGNGPRGRVRGYPLCGDRVGPLGGLRGSSGQGPLQVFIHSHVEAQPRQRSPRVLFDHPTPRRAIKVKHCGRRPLS